MLWKVLKRCLLFCGNEAPEIQQDWIPVFLRMPWGTAAQERAAGKSEPAANLPLYQNSENSHWAGRLCLGEKKFK